MTAILDTAPALLGGVEDCSPTQLADAIRDARAVEVAAGVEVLRLAVAWADAHPALDDQGRPVPTPLVSGEALAAHFAGIDPEEFREAIGDRPAWAGLPRLGWDAEAGFAVTAGLSTRAGSALLRDALILRHRLPAIWAKVTTGAVPAWRARLIAVEVAGAPDDVCAAIDAVVAPVADRAGTVSVRRLVNEAMVRLYPDVVAVRSWQDLERRYVHLDRDHLGHTAIAGMDIRADYADLVDLDHVLTELAHRLPTVDPEARRETLEQRRARALGVLADPARAHHLLSQSEQSDPDDEPAPATPRAATRRRSTTLVLRITDLALLGVADAGTIETGPRAGAAVLTETIAAWCGRAASDLTVLPVLDTTAHHAGTAYAAPVTVRRHLAERDQHCLFPFCDRPAASCDCDHVVPYAEGGPTCACNLVALCRHHHRLKTHAGYTARLIEPGVVWWTTPWGHQFTVTREGTQPVPTGDHRAPPRPVCLK
ncbi:MAG: hypothetical protein ACTHJH_16900 [Marmoricola sp.]